MPDIQPSGAAPAPTNPPDDQPSTAYPVSWKLFTGFLILACAALCLLVLLLSRENRQLKARVQQLVMQPPGRPPAPKIGDTLTPLTVIDKSGAQTTLALAATPDLPNQRTLILALSASCPHCETTIPIWNEILRQVGSPAVRIVGLQLEAQTAAQLQPTLATFEVRGILNPRETWAYSIPMVPATIMTSPTGVIEHAWFGELSKSQQEELTTALIRASAGG